METKERQNQLGYGALVLMQCIIWGLGNAVTKIGLESITPFYCLALRFTLASVVFFAFFAKRVVSQLRQASWVPCLLLCVFNAGAFILCNLALKFTSATNVGFFMSLSVIFTPIISYFVLKTGIKKMHIIIMIVVTFGLFFLCKGEDRFIFGIGDLLALLCAVSLGATLTLCSKYVAEIDPPTISTIQCIFVAIVSWMFAFIFEDFSVISNVEPVGWAVVIYLALACSCLAYLFQNTALAHVSASKVSVMQCSQPVFTAAASFLILGETLTMWGLLGAVLIIVSIVVASFS